MVRYKDWAKNKQPLSKENLLEKPSERLENCCSRPLNQTNYKQYMCCGSKIRRNQVELISSSFGTCSSSFTYLFLYHKSRKHYGRGLFVISKYSFLIHKKEKKVLQYTVLYYKSSAFFSILVSFVLWQHFKSLTDEVNKQNKTGIYGESVYLIISVPSRTYIVSPSLLDYQSEF